LNVAVEAGGTTLDERYIASQAHLVDMSACIEVIERVEDDVELLEPCDVELRVLDVVVVGFDLDVGVELLRRFFGNLLWC